ncbi:rhodanese-like domain-containing protein 8, chloroplastic isoform X2 [Phragmites australis]|uniref:rhodanese-like domain-containing protein 8, chloroplastic isoform X2 n=1 Tax=Phragmites australis TaxID=29695 RepID=UPI002D77AC27|nr:rhodanese-like domain-containing protein 8, chloroplastic isoform X2 [Phragmites australis]
MAVHHHILLRPLSAPLRHTHLSFSLPPLLPPPARVRSSLPAPACRLATHADAIEEPEFVPPEVEEAAEEDKGDAQFVVVTFYKFVPLDDPRAEVASHLQFLQGRDIHGRIYMNEQGINAQYSGPHKDAMAYADWLRKDYRFRGMLVQTSPALNGHAFPRLKLRYKPSLVQLEGGSSHLPLVDPGMRATPLTPLEWRERLEAWKCIDLSSNKASGDTFGRKLLLLDVRNDYEWDIGHFQGAQRPNVDCFRSTSFGLSEEVEDPSDPLNGVDKEKTDILMYCTGGIRCDVYSTILRKKGFCNLYTLVGGVSNYLKMEGAAGWVGNLFVFDGRLSLPPATFGSPAEADADDNRWVGRCYSCGSEVVELRHRNCANIDCNRLYLSVLRVVCGRAGRVLLLRVQSRPSAATAPAGPPEIQKMACLP